MAVFRGAAPVAAAAAIVEEPRCLGTQNSRRHLTVMFCDLVAARRRLKEWRSSWPAGITWQWLTPCSDSTTARRPVTGVAAGSPRALYLYSSHLCQDRIMLAIRLPDAIEQRLAALALETGRTKTSLAREAILEYIDDLEDYHLAEARARRNRKTIPLEDVERELGL
jgi:RHH-type transcriptional regulator, rel operon repressor / antitoxin RelB